MKIGFFGQSGPFAAPALRELLVSQQATTHPGEVVMVVEGKRRPMGRVNHRWQMPSLRRSLASGLPKGQSLSELALAAGIPVFQTCDINSKAAFRELSKLPFDLLICVGFDRLFGRSVVELPRLGAWNCHPSMLPDLRGPSPVFWSLKRGDQRLGVTIHCLDLREDHGPILHQGSVSLAPMATGHQIYEAAGAWFGGQLGGLIEELRRGGCRGVAQGQNVGQRARRVKAEDVFVEPRDWGCEHLVRFACGAPYFRAPWLRMGGETFHIRRGLGAVLGRNLPAQYILAGSELIVGCRDGVAHLEIQV